MTDFFLMIEPDISEKNTNIRIFRLTRERDAAKIDVIQIDV